MGLDGQLQPLPRAQVAALKQRCGRGGLRVLALAYKDMLLPPAAPDRGLAGAYQALGSSNGSKTDGPEASDKWQLLEDDKEQQDLVLIGLLGLEDPGGRQGASSSSNGCGVHGSAAGSVQGSGSWSSKSFQQGDGCGGNGGGGVTSCFLAPWLLPGSRSTREGR